ncbi:uncharacterized protein LOC119554192 [Drosophila subpulchrella]|uniref:uncharacterized protein LOC119554192 n=1 Tax=Drosophila subpulchrella TaxID=1486046 RepID=UPI0018A16E6E|nr:uncharacterized protein LOC119554192 [Drosophila subpulchrella]
MSKLSRGFKKPPVGSSSVSSISVSGSESGHGLEGMLHVTKVKTSEVDEVEFYLFKDGTQKSNSDLPKKISTPDVEEGVPTSPPYVALVSNLPMECTERELNKVLTNFSVRSLTIPKKGKRPKGFAYVEMDSREDLIGLLRLEKLKCRGRCLMIKISQDQETPVKGGGDAPSLSPLPSSEFDVNSEHYSASVSDLSVMDSPSSEGESPSPLWPKSESSFYGRDTPITRKPSSTEELERRMEMRLQKLAEFENAESEKAQNENLDDQDTVSMSWSEVLSETRNSEGI